MNALAIGIDIGGSHITSALVDADGKLISKKSVSLSQRTLNALVSAIQEASLDILSSIYAPQIKAVGLAVPGNVDPFLKTARYMPNFSCEQNIPLGSLVQEALGLSDSHILSMRNDGRCMALAESKLGEGRESKVLAVLTLGTGIGGALVAAGTLFDGSSFDAGDFGHHVIYSQKDSSAMQCACGQMGCFETHASAEGLVRHYKRLSEAMIIPSSSSSLPNPLNAEAIIVAMRIGDSVATEAFNNYLEDLATGLANLVTFYNPDTIVLGGGLAQAQEIFRNLTDRVDAKTLPATRGKVRIVPSALGPDAGAIGAALLAHADYNNAVRS